MSWPDLISKPSRSYDYIASLTWAYLIWPDQQDQISSEHKNVLRASRSGQVRDVQKKVRSGKHRLYPRNNFIFYWIFLNLANVSVGPGPGWTRGMPVQAGLRPCHGRRERGHSVHPHNWVRPPRRRHDQPTLYLISNDSMMQGGGSWERGVGAETRRSSKQLVEKLKSKKKISNV
jgi:hypothetical protein